MDLGDSWSCYAVLNESGELILEQKAPTTPEGMQQVFGKMARSRIAMETGTHSPWVSRLGVRSVPTTVFEDFEPLQAPDLKGWEIPEL